MSSRLFVALATPDLDRAGSVAERVLAQTGVRGTVHDQVRRRAELAHAAGVLGIRSANGATADQKRIVTPRAWTSALRCSSWAARSLDPDAAARAIGATL